MYSIVSFPRVKLYFSSYTVPTQSDAFVLLPDIPYLYVCDDRPIDANREWGLNRAILDNVKIREDKIRYLFNPRQEIMLSQQNLQDRSQIRYKRILLYFSQKNKKRKTNCPI